MINILQEGNQTPHIEIDRADRQKQIRSCRFAELDEKSSCYKILNKKNKVFVASEMGGATPYYAGRMDCTALCC